MQPIVVIEDDPDDQEIISRCLLDLDIPNPLVFFKNGDDAFTYLCDVAVRPFIIFSDINMPGIDGLELRDKIHADEELRRKCIPYIFITTSTASKMIWNAYSQNAQGYFIKPYTLSGWKALLNITIEYWKHSKKPLRFE